MSSGRDSDVTMGAGCQLPGWFRSLNDHCNGHYNRAPDLGKYVMWWNMWDLARLSILDAKVLDHNVTWLTKHKDTS